MKSKNTLRIALGLSLLASLAAQAAPVGRVLVAVGDTSAVRGGQPINLSAGSAVEVGDTLQVGEKSNLQVRFVDEAIVALRANSAFKIDDYKFAQEPESDSSIFSLIKGGMRTITGAIGKLSRKNYAVKTETSTIGIRGTHFNLVHCNNDCRNPDGSLGQNGTFGAITDGRIAVGNQSGEREFGKNEFFFVANAGSLPEQLLVPPAFLRDRLDGMTRTKGKSGDKGGEASGSGMTEDSRLASSGVSPTITTPTITDPPPAVVDGLVNVSWVSAEGIADGYQLWFETEGSGFGGEAVSSNDYQSAISWAAPYIQGFSAEAGNVYWGVDPWPGGTGDHFAFGDAPTSLPTSGIATYSRIGGTAPADNFGNTGSVSTSALSINFGTQTFSLGLQYSVGGASYIWNISNQSYAGEFIPTLGTHVTCSGTCYSLNGASLTGAITGKNAEGAIAAFATSGENASYQPLQSATVQVYKKQ